MKTATKKYVEYLFPGSRTVSMEINHTIDPMEVDRKQYSIGFRFYEREILIDNDKQIEGKIKNITNWFLDGTRFTFDDILELYGYSCDEKYDDLSDYMLENNILSVCITDDGEHSVITPMADGDITLDEYFDKVTKANKKPIKVRVFPHKGQ